MLVVRACASRQKPPSVAQRVLAAPEHARAGAASRYALGAGVAWALRTRRLRQA